MKPTLRTFSIILIYMFLCFIGLMIFSFCVDSEIYNTVLQKDLFLLKFITGILLFIGFLPSICATAGLIGFSWGFSSTKAGILKRFSKTMMKNLKNVMVIACFSVFISFLASEVLKPILENKQTSLQNNARNYQEFLYHAKQYNKEGNFDLASFYVSNALKIFPKSTDALDLQKIIEYSNVSAQISEEYSISNEIAKYVANLEETKKTPSDEINFLLTKSKEYFNSQDFFNAHYYAIHAQYLAEKGSLNYQTAMNLATDAWNMISTTENKYDKEMAEIYAEKKRGYIALLEEDFIKAYYIFTELEKKGLAETDLLFYKDVAEQGLINSTFFIDETESLRSFESSKDIYFTITNNDGSKDVIFIQGITILEDAGQFLQYFRDFYMYSYDKNGNFIKSLYTPYAKMVALPVSSLNGNLSNLDVNPKGYVPYVLLKSIDRESSSTSVLPSYKFANNVKNKDAKNSIILEIPYEDFNLIRQASKGQESMPLAALFSFAERADKYGYSAAIYYCSLAKRITYPLFLLSFFIFLAAFGWNYRLMPGKPFAFRWIFLFPIINFILLCILKILEHFINICFFILFNAIGGNAVIISACIFILSVFCFSLIFLSSRGE